MPENEIPESSHATGVTGGKYINGDRYVDAEGKDLGAAPKKGATADSDRAAASTVETESTKKNR